MWFQGVDCCLLNTEKYEGLDKADNERISAYKSCGHTLLIDRDGHVYAVQDVKWIADAKLRGSSYVQQP